MSDQAVRLDVEAGVATITLDQPDRYNAFSDGIHRGIRAALEELEGIPASEVRCVVFEGAGEAFSAGGDVERMREAVEEGFDPEERARDVESRMKLMARVAAFPRYTVAKIDGPAVGAGAALAIACDLQVASERSVLGFVFRNVGLAVDNGVSHLLPRIVGTNTAKELVATGRLVGADEAADLGLVNHVYPDGEFDERADEFVREVAEGPTVALARSKELLDDGPSVPLERAIEDEATAQAIVMQTRDHAEGVEAFLEDREPDFEGR